MITLQKNDSPKNGSCKITPNSGFAISTNFQISCSEWADEDNKQQPFIYELAVYLKNGKRSVLNRGVEEVISKKMPLGNDQENYELQIEVRIEDAFGAATRWDFPDHKG